MPHPNTNGLVGLIVIETSSDPGDVTTVDFANHDATLAQILGWLARGHRARGSELPALLIDETRGVLDAILVQRDERVLALGLDVGLTVAVRIHEQRGALDLGGEITPEAGGELEPRADGDELLRGQPEIPFPHRLVGERDLLRFAGGHVARDFAPLQQRGDECYDQHSAPR